MKFNLLNKERITTVNHAKAKAFTMSPGEELYTAVVTTGISDSFYEKENSRLIRIKELVAVCDPEFVAKLAAYARNEMNLRSVPMVLTVELAKMISGSSIVSKTVTNVVKRADEITELLAYYQLANERKEIKKLNRLSKQIQKGLAKSFNTFDEYQFAKYNRNTEVKLKDALFLVHPKAKDESQQAIFNKIVTNTLAIPYTWETELSILGTLKFENNNARKSAFTQKWEELIESKKVGYMALMRNLRNILEANVSAQHIAMVCDYLANEKAVENSKQLPFRFLAAYREIKRTNSQFTPNLLDALEEAVTISARNIRGFDYNTSVVIACDVSGSMQKPVSAKSSVLLYDIGLMLGMLMQSRCQNVISGMFGDTWKTIHMSRRNILANVEEYYKREGEVGYATNGHLVLDDLIAKNQIVDKVMLFTDVQMWNSTSLFGSFSRSWKKYKKIAPEAKLYLFDLAGYGHQPIDIRQDDVYLLAGWSDKIFDVLNALENKETALDTINKIGL
ncbi:TROVE domain-containing protein [Flavobacterium cerinum]|uniref:TROVE domain-containing protein n=1 Tax=Flavobacterium cerinum TaxID=2502784 RepID=A0ABY5J0F6_9FLAO|nr:TROVE domain-containing protein [Flavobacterium cerinum]UUC47222.1 TROVE domain-containing protein [Flavobacterium cerinum]